MSEPELTPITVELIKGRVASARSEVEVLIERTAMSPVIREKKDYFVAFFSARGELITGSTFPLGANALDAVLETYPAATMRPGDVYCYNDPYSSNGGVSHTPDLVLVEPAYAGGELVAFVQVFGHLWDIGGLAAGSVSPLAKEVFHEGVRLPPVRLLREDAEDDAVLRILLANTRFPDVMRGDVRALAAACHLGAIRFSEIVDHFGWATTEQVVRRIFDQGRTIARDGFARVPDGDHLFVEHIDGDGMEDAVHRIELVLRKRDGRVEVDASGTSDQSRGAINFLMDTSVIGMMYGTYFMSEDPTVTLNAGLLDGVEAVHRRLGSLLRPRFPAALGMRGITWIHTNSAVFGTLAKATDGDAPAASASYVVYYLRGQNLTTGEPVFLMDGLGVGYGARSWADGHDGVYYIGQQNFPVEFLEHKWPIRMLAYGVAIDSGGAGRFRGGVGVVRRVQVLVDGLVFASRVDNVRYPCWGVSGGTEGGPGSVVLHPGTPDERPLPPICDGVTLRAGDIVEIRTSGGGGWGDPRLRPAEQVLRDVRAGLVSPGQARQRYGVVLADGGRDVDDAATRTLRESMPAPTGLFHQRGRYSDVIPTPDRS